MKTKWTVGPLFVAGLCALYCANPMNLFWPFFGACALHELGHFIVIVSFGKTVEAVKLGALGAVIETQTLSYPEELVCSLAGPAVNLGCAAGLQRAAPAFAILSLLLALFNLLPLYPLDGGRALQALMRWCFGETACRICMTACKAIVCTALVAGAVWASCIRHYGMWPALLAAAVLVKLDGTSRSEK